MKRSNKKKERNARIEIAYICNGKNPECSKDNCYYENQSRPCDHTREVKYAKYKPVDDPKKHPDRFNKVTVTDFDGTKIIRYYEKLRKEPPK